MDKKSSQNPVAPTVFLAHSSEDKEQVRDFYRLLSLDGVEPWLDEENLVPGQDWEIEVGESLKNADAIVVFLSSRALDSAGYVHKEIRIALEAAERLPERSILLIPLMLDDCTVPLSLQHLHWLSFSRTSWRPVLGKSIIPNDVVKKLQIFSVGDRYLYLQTALLIRGRVLSPLSNVRPVNYWLDIMIDEVQEEERVIDYLVRGQHPGGVRYYGIASMRIRADELTLRTKIGAEVHEYEGELDGGRLRFTGAHNVQYWRSGRSNLLVGTWDGEGLEELIPAANSRRTA